MTNKKILKTIDYTGKLCYNIDTIKKGEIKMTKNEIKERIDRLEDLKFYLNMKDRWTTEDYKTINRYHRELQELKKQLEAA